MGTTPRVTNTENKPSTMLATDACGRYEEAVHKTFLNYM
jgi:hypothetical protein